MSGHRWVKRKVCRKVAYPTAIAAHMAADALNNKSDEFLHAYWCGFCRTFHVGHVLPSAHRRSLVQE